MTGGGERPPSERPRPVSEVGLCASCTHARPTTNARGSTFWRCRAADHDPGLRRYPELPVTRCHAHEPRPGD